MYRVFEVYAQWSDRPLEGCGELLQYEPFPFFPGGKVLTRRRTAAAALYLSVCMGGLFSTFEHAKLIAAGRRRVSDRARRKEASQRTDDGRECAGERRKRASEGRGEETTTADCLPD